MTFETLKEKYKNREPAYPSSCPKPNENCLNELIEKYNCNYPQSFIEFQLKYCLEIPLGEFAFEGLGFANNDLNPNMKLEEVLVDYQELEFPDYLTPFRYENGDYWCFDNRGNKKEFPVVIYDHNSNSIESNPEYKWDNFIDWIDKTMDDSF